MNSNLTFGADHASTRMLGEEITDMGDGLPEFVLERTAVLQVRASAWKTSSQWY